MERVNRHRNTIRMIAHAIQTVILTAGCVWRVSGTHYPNGSEAKYNR